MTSLTLVRRIAARPSIVFNAITTPEGIATWFGPDDLPALASEFDARVGGAYRVRFRTLDGREHEASGECIEVTPPRRVVLSWRWTVGGEPDEAGRVSRLEFDLRPIDTGTELTLTHADLSSVASTESHEWGWTGSLAKLVRTLTTARGLVA